MTIIRTDRNQIFAPDGTLVSEDVVDVDITNLVLTLDLHAKARTALASNTAALTTMNNATAAIATAVTNCNSIIAAPVTNVAQAATQIDNLAAEIKRIANVLDGTVTQTGRTLRMSSQMIRLVIGADLLVENTDS